MSKGGLSQQPQRKEPNDDSCNETDGRGLAQEGSRDFKIAVLHFLHLRGDFFFEELAGSAGDGVVFVGEIFRSEDFGWGLVLYKKEPAGGFGIDCGCHESAFQIRSKIPAAPWPPPTHMVTRP